MESKEPITAESILNKVCFEKYGYVFEALLFHAILPQDEMKDLVLFSMKEFAKHHRKEQIEAIKAEMDNCGYFYEDGTIENAYTESNIK